ncbi:MAG: hypothetical protein WC444_07340 [Candidatus Paceibacterota bacterium]
MPRRIVRNNNPTVKTVSVDKDIELFNDISQKVTQAQNDSQVWADKHDKFYRLRMRIKKSKSFPFPGCSNLRLPTIEMYIRKLKSQLVALYSNIKPRMQVVPQSDNNLEKANRIERFIDWLADVKMNLLGKVILLTDKMLEKGFVIAEVDWEMRSDYRTETITFDDISMEEAQLIFSPRIPQEAIQRWLLEKLQVDLSETVQAENLEAVNTAMTSLLQGKDNIKVRLLDELYNAPIVNIIDPADFFTNSDTGMDIQDSRLCGYEFYRPYDMLKCWASEDKIDQEAFDNIEFIASTGVKDKSLDWTKDMREGIDRFSNPSKLVKLQKVFTYYDLDKDGLAEKVMFLLAPEFKQVLKRVPIPYDHKKFPFIKFSTEIIDDRWFSPRGVPEHLEDISKEIDAQHNQKIDNQTIRNAPMFKFRSGIVNHKLVKFIPGQGIPIPGQTPLDDAIKLIDNNNPNVEFSYEREEMLLKTTLQEYMGVVDYSLQSMVNKRQPRTLGEVQMQAQAANQVFSLESSMFTNSLSELFMQILELCQQYMPERVYTLVSGENGIEPIHMTRDEIQGKYNLVAKANDINTNPNVKLQRALSNVQILLQPVSLQSGVVNPMNVYNIFKRYLQDGGELAWKEMISMPQPPDPNKQPLPIEPRFEDLAEGEQAQVLVRLGIRPDIVGRMLEKKQEMMNEHGTLIKNGNGKESRRTT